MSFVNVQERKLPFAFRYLSDLLAYRHMCWNLVGSDLRSRFRRSRLGILWALIQPLGFAIMIAFVWGALDRKMSTWDFALYVLAGQAVFDLFSNCVNSGQNTLQSAGGYLKQARVPFFVFQLRTVLTAMVFFLIEMLAVVGFALAIGSFPPPGEHLLFVPLFVVVAMLFCLPVCILFSIGGTLYRDLRHASTLILRAFFLMSPIMMPREIMAQPHLKFMEIVNPLISLLDLFRDPMIYGRNWEVQDILVISVWTVALWALALICSASVGRKLVFAL